MRAVAFVSVLLLALARPILAGDLAAANAAFAEGNRLAAAGKWAEACAKFEASVAADSSPGGWGQLADCYEHLDRMADAWGAWQRVVAKPRNDEQRDFAKERMAKLFPNLPYLLITIVDAPAAAVVERDGRSLPAGEINLEVPVNKGTHTIVVSAPGYVSQTQTIEVAPKQHGTVTFGALEKAPEPPPPPPRPERPRPTPWVSISLAGAGVLGLGVSGLVGLAAKSQRDLARDAGCNTDLSGCTPLGYTYAQRADSRASIATGVAIGSSVLLVGGIVYYVISREHRRASDQHAWIEPVGTSGAIVSFGGSL